MKIKKVPLKNNISKKHIGVGIAIISVCIIVLIIIYLTKSREEFSSHKYLYKRKYKCNSPHLIPSFSPDLCCRQVKGKLRCDNNRNCKCKNRKTGICETCYSRAYKFKR